MVWGSSDLPPLPGNPSLYQINARSLVATLGRDLGRTVTLADIPVHIYDTIASKGFHIVYLLGVWSTGKAGEEMSRQKFANEPSVDKNNIASSPFAVTDYAVSEDLGGNAALKEFRRNLHDRGILLLLDFVPNHVAIDHPWTVSNPEFLLQGTEEMLSKEPQNYFESDAGKIFAHGKDPNYDGWKDTVQLNYFDPRLREKMARVLKDISAIADGVRCDMAMLVLPDIFERTWGDKRINLTDQEKGKSKSKSKESENFEFWSMAIKTVKKKHPKFIFMAETYWDRERDLQECGFDYTYDKKLYDHLVRQESVAIKDHLGADAEFQTKSVHFLENHDERRAALVFPDINVHTAAAAICYLVPGMKFFHHGQLQGRKTHLSMHLRERAAEPEGGEETALYNRLLSLVRHEVVREGRGERCLVSPSQDQDPSHAFLVSFALYVPNSSPTSVDFIWVVVNYSQREAHGHVKLPESMVDGSDEKTREYLLQDLFGHAAYVRSKDDVFKKGVWFKLAPMQVHVFELVPFGINEI